MEIGAKPYLKYVILISCSGLFFNKSKILIAIESICSYLNGRMAEWSNAAVLKTAEPETVPGVRIPLLPPFRSVYFFLLRLPYRSDHVVL